MRWRERSGRGPSVGALLAAAAAVIAVATLPGAGPYTHYVAALAVVNVIAALSLNMLMGYAGQVSLGQAALVGIGAYAAAQLAAWDVPFPLILPAAAAITTVAATIVGLPALRIRGLELAAATLAFGVVAERLVFARPWDTSSVQGMAATRPAMIADDGRFLVLALGVAGVVVLLDLAVRHSRLGRSFATVRDREDTAVARGIPVATTKLLAYALSGFVAGLAGATYAFLLERVTPDPFTLWASLGYVAAVIIGGAGSAIGVAVTAGAFAALPELLRPAAVYAPLVGGVLLMVLPVIRPEGLGWLLERRVPLRRPDRTGQPPPSGGRPPVLGPVRRDLRLVVPRRTLLDVDGVAVSFGGNRVLTDVDLQVGRHQRVGLIGPNGAGKTTLFNCISGFLRPQQGRLTYRGVDLGREPPHRRPALGIARTFQQVGLSPMMTVHDNVVTSQHLLARYDVVSAVLRLPPVGRVERELERRAWTALELIGITGLADVPVGALPHGQKRLAELAAAVASSPELLLLDEPATGMSPEEADDLATLLRRLQRSLGLTVVLIDHHVPFVTAVCDHVVVLAEGRIIAAGSPAEVRADPRVADVYLGAGARDREAVTASA